MSNNRTPKNLKLNVERFADALLEHFQIKLSESTVSCESVILTIDEIDEQILPNHYLPNDTFIYIDYFEYRTSEITITGIFILNNSKFLLLKDAEILDID